MLIDSLSLAYCTFQSCRHFLGGTAALLPVLLPTLDEVQRDGKLIFEVPDARVAALFPETRRRIEARIVCVHRALPTLPEQSRPLLAFCVRAATELQRLWTAGARGTVRSLGYAMHNVPHLIRTGEALDPQHYMFCFRVVAFHWQDFSAEMRTALAKAVDLEPAQADEVARRPGFGIDMFGSA